MKDAKDPVDDDELALLVQVPSPVNHGYYLDNGEKWIIKFDGNPIKCWSGNSSWSSELKARNALQNCHNMYWEIRQTLARLRGVNENDNDLYHLVRNIKFRRKYVKALIDSGRVVIERIQ